MGCVYRAYDPKFARTVAIKLMLSRGDAGMRERFRNEVQVIGNLHHKNIVTVHDTGEHDENPYLVMEYLDGQTLKKILADKEPLTLVEKVWIMLQVAEGLQYAHHRRIVHRDIKPANIMKLNGVLPASERHESVCCR